MKRIAFLITIIAALAAQAPTYAAKLNADWALKMFEETSHNFGVVARGSEVQHRLKLTNIYQETVQIADVKTSCGCSAAKPSQKTLNSLEAAYIEISMDTKKFSRQKDSSVIITFSAPQFAEVRIPISAYIRTDVVTEPGSVSFGNLDQGVGGTRTVEISYAGRPDWKITDVQNLPDDMTAELQEVSRTPQQIKYQLKVKLDPTAAIGSFRSVIQLITDDSNNPQVPLLVEGDVVPDIVVNPGVVSLGILSPGQTKTVNVVLRGKKPFRIEKVECETDLNAFHVQMPQDERAVHVLPLTISTPDGTGTLVEEFTVTINGRKDPITFKAFCKVVAKE